MVSSGLPTTSGVLMSSALRGAMITAPVEVERPTRSIASVGIAVPISEVPLNIRILAVSVPSLSVGCVTPLMRTSLFK